MQAVRQKPQGKPHQTAQDMEEKNSGVEDKVEEMDNSVKESIKYKNIQAQRIQAIWDSMKRLNL